MPRRDEGMEEVRMEESMYRKAKERSDAALTKVADFGAQVIIAKESGIALAVIYVDAQGTHIRGITDQLCQDRAEKNYVWGQSYVEALAQEIKKQDEEGFFDV